MKNLKTKLLGFLRWLCVGRRRHSDDDDDDYAKCTFKQQRKDNKKIHPSPCLIDPKDGGIDDLNTPDDDTKGIELLIEPSPKKEIAGPSGLELSLEPNPEKEITGLLGNELLLEPNPEKEITGPSELELLLEPNLEKEINGPSGNELLLEPNPEKEINETLRIDLSLKPSPNELLLEHSPEKETTESLGTELFIEPNPEKKDISGPSENELLLEPNPEKEINEPSRIDLSLELSQEKEISGSSGNELLLEHSPEKKTTGSLGIALFLEPNPVQKEITGASTTRLLVEPNPEKTEITGPSGIELLLEPNPDKEFSYQDIQMLTDNFAKEISSTQFGKLYAGRIPDGWKGMEGQDVTIKMWNHDSRYRSENWDTLPRRAKPSDALNRMASEINILSQPDMETHPSLPTIKGYCFEAKKLGVVYGIEPKRTLRAVIGYGSFKWARMIKVALGLARLLEFLHRHQPQFLVRNLAASHIMLDKDWNPILVDCSMLVGGGFGDTRKAGKGGPTGSHAYTDIFLCFSEEWTDKSDVFAYGMILLELLFKRTYDAKYFRGCYLDHIAKGLYRKFAPEVGESNFSFTVITDLGKDRSFAFSDGAILSKLAVRCVDHYREPRPTMTEIIGELEKLRVMKKLAAVKE